MLRVGVSCAAVILVSSAVGFGQTASASITGNITDPTGAAIAGAPVEVHNLETGSVFKAASSQTGNYTVSQLPVGDYDLTVGAPGFKKYSHTNFHLDAGQTMREDIALEVGQASESVTVSAEASLLQTETSDVVLDVTLSQLDNLPLIVIGATNDGVRDPFSAANLLPGVEYCNTPPNCNAVVSMVINGTPANTYQNRLDGATMNPTGLRLLGASMETQPSTDAIQEVSTMTSNFAPEFGTAGGAVMNMVTKSGTNQLHGSAYDYLVNTALNAAQPYTGNKNAIHQNDYGFTVGGPVWIPKVYDGRNRTFFFFSWEQFVQRLYNDTTPDTVPIPAYRAGDFSSLITDENRLITTASGPYVNPLGATIQSGTIFDPATTFSVNGAPIRNPFPNNAIPASRFDPVAVKVLSYVPLPSGPNAAQGGLNYLVPIDEGGPTYIPSFRIDQNLGNKFHTAFYFQNTQRHAPRSPTGSDDLPAAITTSDTTANGGRTMRFNLDHTVTPVLLLHYTFAWNDSNFKLSSQNYPFNTLETLGIPGQTAARTFPEINTTVSTNIAEGGMSNLGGEYDQNYHERRPEFTTSATYVRGAHTYKAGFEIRQQKFPNFNYTGSSGIYTFNSNWTTEPSLASTTVASGFAGFGFASFLLGGLSQAEQVAPITAMTYNYEAALYVQDDWKATRKLTLNYGVRWDYGTAQREQFGRYSEFSATTPNPSASDRLGAQIYEATCHCRFAHNYPYALGPRLGASYQIDRKTVVRGGFGAVYGATSVQTAGGTTNTATTTTPAYGQIVGLLQNGIPPNVIAQWPTFNPAAGQPVGAVVAAPPLLDPNAGRPLRLLQWNVTVQREIGHNIALQAGYVANVGVWEEAGTTLAPHNALSQQTLAQYGITPADFTNSTLGLAFATPISNLSATQLQMLNALGIDFQPYSNFPNNQTVRQSLVPFPQYTGLLTPVGAPLGKNWYEALQLQGTKRFSHGLSLQGNYTYSKALALISTIDPYNRYLGKNLSPYDLPSQFRLTAQYEVPRIQSSLPLLSNKVVAYALSGWGVGWYSSYQSAPLVTLPTSAGTDPISNFLGYGPGPAQLIPGMSPWSVNWTSYNGVHHTTPLNINCGCFNPATTVVLNPAAFENVPNGQFGANQSSIRWFRGMRVPVENATFSRNFRVRERMSLNIRVQFTNIFNRLVYPVITAGTLASVPTVFTTGPNTGLYSGGFGTITPEAGTLGYRAGTLVGRFQF